MLDYIADPAGCHTLFENPGSKITPRFPSAGRKEPIPLIILLDRTALFSYIDKWGIGCQKTRRSGASPGKNRIYKTETETGKPMEGIVFKAYSVVTEDGETLSEIPTAEEIARFAVDANLAASLTTDESGYAAATLARGTYLLIEEPDPTRTQAPIEPMYFIVPCAVEKENENGELELVYEDVVSLNLKNTPPDEPGSVSVSPQAEKVINDWGPAESFTFVIKAVTKDAPMPKATTAVATKAAPTAVFSSIVFFEPGVYEYTITEVDDGVPGVSYDTTPHSFTVTVMEVTENPDYPGQLTCSYTYGGSDKLVITNTYKALPVTVEFPGLKTIDGIKDTKAVFTFELKETTEGATYTDSAQITASGEFSFKSITYDEPGVYTYEITETAGREHGWTYDSKVYTVTVTVTDDKSGTLKADVEGLEEGKVIFRNRYTPDNPPTGEAFGPLFWAGILVLTSAAAVWLLLRRRKTA